MAVSVVRLGRRVVTFPIQEGPTVIQAVRSGAAGLKDGSTIALAKVVAAEAITIAAQKVTITALPHLMRLPGGNRVAKKAMTAAYRNNDCIAA